MKYGSRFGAFKITFTMFMLDFKVIESIEKFSDVSFYSVLDVEEVKLFIRNTEIAKMWLVLRETFTIITADFACVRIFRGAYCARAH